MLRDFPTGKILVHYARQGAMDHSPKQKFWAKSYGRSHLERGDIITISIGRETEGKIDAMWWKRPPMTEKWLVTEVKGPGDLFNEYITYFERIK